MIKKITILLITVLAFTIRVVNYRYPPLLWDEAALGYNAFSLATTGADEFGQKFPLIFKSFGDYKPGLYVYLSLPFVKFLGLNELSVRLPSIILGSLLPLIIYLFILKHRPKSNYLAIIAALVLALNPFNLHFSRGAWETNVLTFELILASYLFFSRRFLFSSILFGLTLYTYQSGKLISLLLIITLFTLHYLYIRKNLRQLLIAFVLPLFIFSLPVAYGLISGSDSNRLKVVSLFSYPRSSEETKIIINESNALDYQIFHSHPIFFARNFLSRYFNHFSPRFLFFEGDWQNPRHSAPYVGVLLYPSLIFLPLGFFLFLATRTKNPIDWFMFFWLLLAPIPAALTRDSIQATRAMSLSIPLVYFSALGINYFRVWLSKFGYWKLFGYSFLAIGYLISFIYYSDLYYFHMVKRSPSDFLYGYREAIDYLLSHNQNKQVYFTNFYGQPYIFYLFYSQYPPQSYQLHNHYVSTGLDTGSVEQIDQIKFTSPQFNDLKNKSNVQAIFSWDETLRQGIDPKILTPLSPVNGHSTFYAWEN